jgi:hypothetical protein
MSTDDERDRLAQQLLQLPLRELLDVLRQVLPRHTETEPDMQTKLVLASATIFDDDPETTQVELVAWPYRAAYNGHLGPDQELLEDGTCRGCGLPVISSAKRALCPICDSQCGLT